MSALSVTRPLGPTVAVVFVAVSAGLGIFVADRPLLGMGETATWVLSGIAVGASALFAVFRHPARWVRVWMAVALGAGLVAIWCALVLDSPDAQGPAALWASWGASGVALGTSVLALAGGPITTLPTNKAPDHGDVATRPQGNAS